MTRVASLMSSGMSQSIRLLPFPSCPTPAAIRLLSFACCHSPAALPQLPCACCCHLPAAAIRLLPCLDLQAVELAVEVEVEVEVE